MELARPLESALVRRVGVPSAFGTIAVGLSMEPGSVDTLLLVLLGANALALLGWLALQALPVGTPVARSTPRSHAGSASPFFSVHVPTHAEPPDIVADTLRALALSRDVAFEVIVVDNNTADERLWRPVEALCDRLGPRFRFVHRTGVRGAKAGALDLVRPVVDARTTHVVVVDADYRVAPDFLRTARRELARRDTDYLQFPQRYRDGGGARAAVARELDDYFARHARRAETHGAMLLTGTLSVVSLAALDAVGGWRARTVTEDAELALALRARGFAGRYVERTVGRGLLPPSHEELLGQRHRWIVGNVQALLHALAAGLLARAGGRRAVLAQLSAWCSFVVVPAGAMLLICLHAALRDDPLARYEPSLTLAAGSVLLQAGATLALVWRADPLGATREWLEAAALRWSTSLHAGLATLSALALRPVPFRRTRRRASRVTEPLAWRDALCVAFACAAAFAAAREAPLAALALSSLALVSPLGRRADRALRGLDATSAPDLPSTPRT